MEIILTPSDIAIIWEKMQDEEIDTEDQEEDLADKEILPKTKKQRH